MSRRQVPASKVHLARASWAFNQLMDTIPTVWHPERDPEVAAGFDALLDEQLLLAAAARLEEDLKASAPAGETPAPVDGAGG